MKIESGLSPILFHITSPSAATKIVGRNVFNLTPSDDVRIEEELVGGKLFYLSTARSMTSDYIKNTIGRGSVVFQLDGRKLYSTYTGKAVNFWSKSKQLRRRTDELEDRVIVKDKSAIPAIPFITAAYQYLIDDQMKNAMAGAYKEQINLHRLCKKHGIPIYYFEKPKDLIVRNMNRSIKWEPDQNALDPWHKSDESDAATRLANILDLAVIDRPPTSTEGKYLLELAIKEPSRFAMTVHMTVKSLKDKAPGYGEPGLPRENLDRYWKLLRKHEMRDPMGLANFIIDKWKYLA